MLHYAVIGDPVEHSRSPEIYHELFGLCGIDADFIKLRVTRGELCYIRGLSEGLNGFAVTMPHKKAIIPYLDGLDASALRCGAVNIVKRTERGLIGYNTDGKGLLDALARTGFDPLGSSAAILGRGGAALAAAYALTDAGAKVTLLVRSIKKGADNSAPFDTALIDGFDCGCDVFINASPVGMSGEDGFAYMELIKKISPKSIFDMVYLPYGETGLVVEARKLGVPAQSGFAMLKCQALHAFEIWFGQPADRLMRDPE